jgi:hypothetical protein
VVQYRTALLHHTFGELRRKAPVGQVLGREIAATAMQIQKPLAGTPEIPESGTWSIRSCAAVRSLIKHLIDVRVDTAESFRCAVQAPHLREAPLLGYFTRLLRSRQASGQ